MSERTELRRFERAVEVLGAVSDPLVRVDVVRQARERLETLEIGAIRDARAAGATWKAIGALYGLSKQGAQQRFRSAHVGDESA